MVRFTNNASTKLAAALTNTATSFSVVAGTGVLYPNLSTGDWFYVTIVNESTNPGAFEIVKVTARSGDTFTVVRGQDNTTAQAFPADSLVSLRVTAQALEDVYMSSGNYLRRQVVQPGNISAFNFYFDANNGSDSNDGLTSATPVKTWQHLRDIMGYVDLYSQSYGMQINIAAGTHMLDVYALDFSASSVGHSSVVTILGAGIDSTFLDNYNTSRFSMDNDRGARRYVLRNLTLKKPILIGVKEQVTFDTVRISNGTSTTSTYALISTYEDSFTYMSGACVFDVSGTSPISGLIVVAAGYFLVGTTITVTGTYNFTTQASVTANAGGRISFSSNAAITSAGDTISGRKFYITRDSMLFAANGSFWDMNSKIAGSMPGQYAAVGMIGAANVARAQVLLLSTGAVDPQSVGHIAATRISTGTWNLTMPQSSGMAYKFYMMLGPSTAPTGYYQWDNPVVDTEAGTQTMTIRTYNESGQLTNYTIRIIIY